MKIYIFDLDDTIIYHPFGIVNYNKMKIDKNLSKILNNMELSNTFNKIYARDTIPYMKPYIESFKFVEQDIKKYYNDRNKYYFFDDLLDNLKTAKSRGWITIWVNIKFMDCPYYVDYAFPNVHTAIMYFLIDN